MGSVPECDMKECQMKKDTLTLLMTTLLAGMLEVSSVYAKPLAGEAEWVGAGASTSKHAYQHTRKAQIYRMGKRLGLTPEQRMAVRAIVEQHRSQMRALQWMHEQNQSQLREISAAGGSTVGHVRALADRQGKTIADMIVLRIQMRDEIDRLLTMEQRSKLMRMRATSEDQRHKEEPAELSGMQSNETAEHNLALLIKAHRSVL